MRIAPSEVLDQVARDDVDITVLAATDATRAERPGAAYEYLVGFPSDSVLAARVGAPLLTYAAPHRVGVETLPLLTGAQSSARAWRTNVSPIAAAVLADRQDLIGFEPTKPLRRAAAALFAVSVLLALAVGFGSAFWLSGLLPTVLGILVSATVVSAVYLLAGRLFGARFLRIFRAARAQALHRRLLLMDQLCLAGALVEIDRTGILA